MVLKNNVKKNLRGINEMCILKYQWFRGWYFTLFHSVILLQLFAFWALIWCIWPFSLTTSYILSRCCFHFVSVPYVCCWMCCLECFLGQVLYEAFKVDNFSLIAFSVRWIALCQRHAGFCLKLYILKFPFCGSLDLPEGLCFSSRL